MKKFLYLFALPLLIVVQIIVFIFVGEVTEFALERKTSLYEYCMHKEYADSPIELGNCVKEESYRYGNFIKAINRDALEDKDARKGDKGGCDFINLRSFAYTDPRHDLKTRLVYIRDCQDNASINLYQLITNKKFKPNGKATDGYADRLTIASVYTYSQSYEKGNGYRFTSFEEAVSKSNNYFRSDYAQKLAKDYDGQTIREIIKSLSYEIKTYDVFNPFIILLALSPILLIGFFTHKYKQNLLPSKGENITSWLESQKKFRICLLLSLLWALAFILTIIIGEPRQEGLIFLTILGIYPLAVFLSVRFIVLSKD